MNEAQSLIHAWPGGSQVGWASLCAHPGSVNLVMRIHPITHIAVKDRMRPINCTLTMPVFNRVEMNVIDMEGKIIFISNLVFPESPLPDSRFAMFENPRGHKTVPTLHG